MNITQFKTWGLPGFVYGDFTHNPTVIVYVNFYDVTLSIRREFASEFIITQMLGF